MLEDGRGGGGRAGERQGLARLPRVGAREIDALQGELGQLRGPHRALLEQPLRVGPGDEEEARPLSLAELEGEARLADRDRAHVVERGLDLRPAAQLPGDALPHDDPPSRVHGQDAAVEVIDLAMDEGQLDGAVAHRHPVPRRGKGAPEQQRQSEGRHGSDLARF